jgi:hypothetical protein
VRRDDVVVLPSSACGTTLTHDKIGPCQINLADTFQIQDCAALSPDLVFDLAKLFIHMFNGTEEKRPFNP